MKVLANFHFCFLSWIEKLVGSLCSISFPNILLRIPSANVKKTKRVIQGSSMSSRLNVRLVLSFLFQVNQLCGRKRTEKEKTVLFFSLVIFFYFFFDPTLTTYDSKVVVERVGLFFSSVASASSTECFLCCSLGRSFSPGKVMHLFMVMTRMTLLCAGMWFHSEPEEEDTTSHLSYSFFLTLMPWCVRSIFHARVAVLAFSLTTVTLIFCRIHWILAFLQFLYRLWHDCPQFS